MSVVSRTAALPLPPYGPAFPGRGRWPVRASPNGKAEVAEVFPTTGPQEAATTTVLDRPRTDVPQAEAGSTLAIHISGTTAASQDYSQTLNKKLPSSWPWLSGCPSYCSPSPSAACSSR
jgi:hypothetical protein